MQTKVKADGKAPIYARITIDGKYTELSTAKKASPKSWDANSKTNWRLTAFLSSILCISFLVNSSEVCSVLSLIIRLVLFSFISVFEVIPG